MQTSGEAEFIPVEVKVKFEGLLTVMVPKNVPVGRRRPLAENYALCCMVADIDATDTPDEDAIDTFAKDFDLDGGLAEREWVGCSTYHGVGGVWTTMTHEEQDEMPVL